MSFIFKKPDVGNAAADPTKTSNYTEAETLPMVYGVHRLGLRWFTEPFRWKSRANPSHKTDWQFASMSGAICRGPACYVGRVWQDSKLVAWLNWFENGETYRETIINAGDAGNSDDDFKLRIYWGKPGQAADGYMQAHTGQDHPPMPGVCYAVLEQIPLGENSSSIPNIEIEIGCPTPAFAGFPSSFDFARGVNPIAAAYGFLSDPVSGADASALIVASQLAAKAQALEDIGVGGRTGHMTYGNFALTGDKDVASILSDILTYFDGYFVPTAEGVTIDYIPGGITSAEGLPMLQEADMTDDPEIDNPSAGESYSSVTVRFTDADRNMEQAAATHFCRYNKKRGAKAKTIDRNGIRKADQAQALAAQVAYESAQAARSGKASFFRYRAVKADGSPLMPGDRFRLNYAPDQIDQAFLIDEREDDGGESVSLSFFAERGSFPLPYTVPPAAVVEIPEYIPPPIASENVRLLALPDSFGERQAAALICRPNGQYAGAVVHFSASSAGPWAEIKTQRAWAVKATLASALGAGAASIVVSVAGQWDTRGIQAQNAAEQADDRLLALVDDELMSVGAISVPGTDQLTLGLLRGRQNTTDAGHASGAPFWLFYREEVEPFTHREFWNVRVNGAYDATLATKFFKVQPFSPQALGFAAPDGGIPMQLPDYSDASSAVELRYSSVASIPGTPATAPNNWTESAVLGTIWIATRSYSLGAWSAWGVAKIRGEDGAQGKKGDKGDKGDQGLHGLKGADGSDGDSLEVQYSANGTYWHAAWAIGDIYMRHRVGLGAWSASIKFVGSDGATGTRGNLIFQSDRGSSQTWDDAAAEAAIAAAGFSRVLLDRVTQYSTTGNRWSETRFWNGNSWVVVTQIINGGLFVKASIGTEELAANSVKAVHVGTNLLVTQAANIGTEVVENSHIKELAAGKILAGDAQAINLAKAARIYEPGYSRKFRVREYTGTSGTSHTWPATTTWTDSAWSHCMPAVLVGPGHSEQASRGILSPDEDGMATVTLFGQISGHTGLVCAYYRKNGGSFVPMVALSSDDGGTAKISGYSAFIYGVSQSDKFEFYIAPCSGDGGVASPVSTGFYMLQVHSENW